MSISLQRLVALAVQQVTSIGDVKQEELWSASRVPRIAYGRYEVMFLLSLAGLKDEEICKPFGLNRSLAVNSFHHIADQVEVDAKYAQRIGGMTTGFLRRCRQERQGSPNARSNREGINSHV